MSDTAVVELSDADRAALAEAQEGVPEIVRAAEALTIATAEDAVAATEFLSQIATHKKKNETARKRVVKPLQDHAKFLSDQFKESAAPLEQADQIARDKVRAFNAEQARLREEQEAAARETERQQRERAEAEQRAEQQRATEAREKAEREARAAREEAERLEREEAEQRAAEQDALAQEMADMDAIELAAILRDGGAEQPRVVAARAELQKRRERRVAQERAREAQETAEAAGLAERDAAARPAVEPPRAQAIEPTALRSESGAISTSKRMKGTITDPDQVPRAYCSPDQRLINEAVKAGVTEIPGVLVEQVEDLAVRAK